MLTQSTSSNKMRASLPQSQTLSHLLSAQFPSLAQSWTTDSIEDYLHYTQPPPYNRTKVPSQAHKYQTSQQNPFLISSVSFPSTCFHQAQVLGSIIPQLLSPLIELSTNKSKILCSGHTLTQPQLPDLLLPTLAEHSLSLSRNQFLSCLKTHLFTLFYPP